jgi:hypothetical protein
MTAAVEVTCRQRELSDRRTVQCFKGDPTGACVAAAMIDNGTRAPTPVRSRMKFQHTYA